MSDTDNQRPRKPLGLKRSVDAGEVKQTFSHGRTNKVAVEVKRRRKLVKPGEAAPPPPPPPPAPAPAPEPTPAPVAKKPAQKNLGQDKYGGYASWSDLDEAEDEEEEEDYESDASSDMEGGFDDVEREETEALKFARKEDQAALEEEERLKREKLERKRKLLELSKSAAAKKRY